MTMKILMHAVVYLATYGCLISGGITHAVARQPSAEVIGIAEPYVRAGPPGAAVGVAFMRLSNGSAERRYLVAAESNVAAAVELHQHTHIDGVMQMRRIDAIAIAGNDSETLQPGGFHIMLIGLKKPLLAGEHIGMGLIYRDGSRHHINIPIMHMSNMDSHHH